MFKEVDGQQQFVFFSTAVGRALNNMVVNKKSGLGIDPSMFRVDFGYRKIPKILGKKKYKPVTKTIGKPFYDQLKQRIVDEKPDLIVPMGNIAVEAVINRKGINSLRGMPRDETFSYIDGQGVEHSHQCWVLPTLSIENVMVDKNKQGLLEADFTVIKKFVEEGESAFAAKPLDYEVVDDFDRVTEIFTKIIPNQKLTSWDLETNTLHPELVGHRFNKRTKKVDPVYPKPLVISLSWKEGEGCTIPLEHKEAVRKDWWTTEQLRKIYDYIYDFVSNPRIIKVGHNLQFDMRFLSITKGFKHFNSCMDTKVFHFLSVSQDPKTPRDLSTLAFQYTDMGGYDQPLEKYKVDFLNKHLWLFKINQSIEKKRYKEDKKKYLAKDHPYTAPSNEIDGGDFNYEWIPLYILCPYASGDVDCCLRIANKLLPVLAKDDQLYNLATSHYPELEDALAWVESNGMPLDTEQAQKLNVVYAKEKERLRSYMRETIPEVQELEEIKRNKLNLFLKEKAKKPKERNEEIYKKYKKYYDNGTEYNPSPNAPDNGEILYKIMGFTLPYDGNYIKDSAWNDRKPEDKLTWQDYKADTKGALPYLIDHYDCEMARLLMQYSKVATLWQNFTNKLPHMVGEQGTIHGNFNITGTETSRLSSSSPNLQQLPRHVEDVNRFDYHNPIKRMFKTSFNGGCLMNVDFAALEVHVAGLVAQDDEMTQGFLDGVDPHISTASIMHGIPIDKVTGDQRSDAKKITFGLMYGKQTYSLAKDLKVTEEEAQRKVDTYFRSKPKIKKAIDETHDYLKKHGYVKTLQGFRRNLKTVYSHDKSKKADAFRESFNTIIQGTGAFLTNRSLVYIKRFILDNGYKTKVIATVHDSILLDCPKEEIKIMAKAIPYIMCNLPIPFLKINWKGKEMNYPMGAEAEIGVNYNDMVGYEEEEFDMFNSVEGYVSYNLVKGDIKNRLNSGIVTQEQYDSAVDLIESNKQVYQVV